MEKEDAMTDFSGEVIISETITRVGRIVNSLSTGEEDAIDFTDNKRFFNTFNTRVNVARVGAS